MDVIFDEILIRLKSDSSSIGPTPASDSEVALTFQIFCTPYIPWADDLQTTLTSLLLNVLLDSQLK